MVAAATVADQAAKAAEAQRTATEQATKAAPATCVHDGEEELVHEPARVLATFDLTPDERAAIMHALGSTAQVSDRERARALQNVMLKRWAT